MGSRQCYSLRSTWRVLLFRRSTTTTEQSRPDRIFVSDRCFSASSPRRSIQVRPEGTRLYRRKEHQNRISVCRGKARSTALSGGRVGTSKGGRHCHRRSASNPSRKTSD